MKKNEVLSNLAQNLTETEKQTARDNIDAVCLNDLSGFVRADIEQSFTDAQKAQAQENINAEEYRGNQFDIVQNHAGNGKYCKIAEIDLTAHRHDYCYYYFTLCFKFAVNFDASTESGIENGTFLFSEVDYARLNVFGDNGQWLDYDNAVKYNGLSQSIKGVHILREKSGSKVTKYEFWLEVDNAEFNVAGSISVNVIANVGSWAYNGQASRSDRGMKSGWFKVYDETQIAQPMLLTDTMNTLTNSTFVEAVRKPRIAVIDNTATIAEAQAIVQKKDVPFMSFGAVYAWPYVMMDGVQAWCFLNGNFLQIYKKREGYSEAVLKYILYREERNDVTIESTGESLIGKISDPSNWDNPNAPALEIDLYRSGVSVQSFTMRAYWKKGDTSDPAPTKEFNIYVKILGLLSNQSGNNWEAYQVYTYTKTLSPTYTELTSIASSQLGYISEIEIEFKQPNSSRTYKLVYNKFFGQSRFIDMGYGN